MRVALLASVLALAGCTAIWDWVTGRDLKQDMAAVLAQTGTPASLDCAMISGTRAGTCAFTLADGPALARALGMKPQGPDAWQSDDGCTGRAPFKAGQPFEAWFTPNLPKHFDKLRLHGPLRSWHLYWRRDTGQACLEAGYAYG